MSEPISITVTAEYIQSEPDLQMRLFVRNLLKDVRVSDHEKLELLRTEADRYERQLPLEDKTAAN